MKLLKFFLASMMGCSLLLEISEFVQEAIKGDKWFLFVIRPSGLTGRWNFFLVGFHLELNPSSKEEEEAGSDATGTEIKESRRRDWDVAIGI
jgi:hypothetical protein